jgi:hypothetical protein
VQVEAASLEQAQAQEVRRKATVDDMTGKLGGITARLDEQAAVMAAQARFQPACALREASWLQCHLTAISGRLKHGLPRCCLVCLHTRWSHLSAATP